MPISLPLPLLVTGVSGVAGLNAFVYFHRLAPDKVVGIRPRATFRLTGPGIVPLDTEDEAGLEDLFRTHRFRSVLNTTGNCALKSCELNPEMARRTNVLSAAHVARCAARHGARLVHLSSDLVFSGDRDGGYVETDRPDPVTVYGQTMAEGEQVVTMTHPEAALLRISLPMGPSFNRHAGAIDWIQSRFRAGRPATLYFDEVRSATYCDDLNHVFHYFLTNQASGLFHCGGPRAITLNQIGQVVNKVGGYDASLLRGCPRHAAGPLPPRAGNVSMDSSKLIALLGGNPFHPWPLLDQHVPDTQEWHHQREETWTGSQALLRQHLYRPSGRDSVVDHVLDSVLRTVPAH
ncbi:MAG: sugar nucleotide-binding protein [Gemmataceae bacterium]